MICGSGGSKSRLAKVAGAEPAGQMRDEKLHAVVARSTCRSQNVQNTPAPDHFWKLRCRKSARRCGAKHISKSKCKKKRFQTTFGGSDVASRGRRKGLCTLSKVSKREGFVAFSTTTTTTPHYTPTLHYTTTTTTTTPSLHSTTLHSTTLHCTQLHSITLHYTTLHYTPLHYTTRFTTLHYTTLHNTTTTPTQLHSTTLHYTKLRSTTLNYITLHYTTLHSTTLTTLHYTTRHYLPLHYTTHHYPLGAPDPPRGVKNVTYIITFLYPP